MTRKPSAALRLAIQQKLAAQSPANAMIRDRIAYALLYLGDVVRSLGRAAEANDLYERATALTEPRVRDDRTNMEHRYALVCSIRRRGLTLCELGKRERCCSRRAARRWRCIEGLPSAVGVGVVRDRACLLSRGTRGTGRASRIGGLGGRGRGGSRQGDGMASPGRR